MNINFNKLLWRAPDLYVALATGKEVFKRDKHFARKKVVRKNSRMVIEGYPRCANTFFTFRFLLSNPNVSPVAHHYHSPIQITKAKQYGVPAVLLTRDPIDAVASFHKRESGIGLEDLFVLYKSFYEPLVKLGPYPVIVDFQDATKNFSSSIKKVNKKFSTSFEERGVAEDEVFKLIEERNAFHNNGLVNESKIARPSADRKEKKEIVVEKIKKQVSSQLITECESIYGIIKNF